MNGWDLEADRLAHELRCGRIRLAQYNSEMRELARDYRDAADEAADEAYDRERERW